MCVLRDFKLEINVIKLEEQLTQDPLTAWKGNALSTRVYVQLYILLREEKQKQK